MWEILETGKLNWKDAFGLTIETTTFLGTSSKHAWPSGRGRFCDFDRNKCPFIFVRETTNLDAI